MRISFNIIVLLLLGGLTDFYKPRNEINFINLFFLFWDEKSWIIFAFVLLSISLVSSIQIDIDSELNQGETLVVKFSGEFYKPILENNVYFYRDTYIAVPIEFELLKIEGDYYISACESGKIPNYSLVIKNSEYSVAGGQKVRGYSC